MENVIHNISQVVGIAVIQSLVQGIFIYLLLKIVLMLVPVHSATAKYYVAFTALTGLTGWFVYELLNRISDCNWAIQTNDPAYTLTQLIHLPVTAKGLSLYTELYYHKVSGLFPYMAALYFTGLGYHSVALFYAGNRISKIRKQVSIDISLLKRVNHLSALLHINKKISTGISAVINVPCIAGYFKPVILLPLSLLTTLSSDEVEAILLHELAHVKRNDYLLNLVQQAMAAILFFNPFALLIGRIIHSERENSCDDIVVRQTAKPLVYAHALLKLQQTTPPRMQLALAASGSKYHLLNRIERIMKTKKTAGNVRQALITLILFAAGISCIAWLNPKKSTKRPILATTKNLATNNSFTPLADTSTLSTLKHLQADTDTIKRSKSAHQRTTAHSAANNMLNDSYPNLSPEQQQQVDSAAKKGEEIAKMFNSPEWKAQVDAMKKEAIKMAEKFNSPEWKAQVDKMAKEGAAMAEKFNSPQWKAQVDKMAKESAAMAEQYNSPEWKKQMLAMSKQAEDVSKKFNSPEWKAEVEGMQKQAELMADKFNSAEWKAQVDKMARQGAAMSKKFNGPEWKKQVERMQKQAETISKKFDTPEWKMQVEQMQKQASDLAKRYSSPEWKTKDSTEVKERPEQPEQPERPENQEKPEKTN